MGKAILTFTAQQYGLTAEDVAERFDIPLKDIVVEGELREYGCRPEKRKNKLISPSDGMAYMENPKFSG